MLGIAFLNIHNACDEMGRALGQAQLDAALARDPRATVGDLIAAMYELPETRIAARHYDIPLELAIGDASAPAGRAAFVHGCLSAPEHDIVRFYWRHGIPTVMALHTTFEDLERLRQDPEGHLILTGHYAGDSYGFTPFVRALREGGVVHVDDLVIHRPDGRRVRLHAMAKPVLDAAGVPLPTSKPFDGKSLLPLLTNATRAHHRDLFWSEGGSTGEWAVRSANWKMVVTPRTTELFDLAGDPGEKNDLAKKHPDKVAELTKLYDAWLELMAEPMSGDAKRYKAGAADAASKKQDRKEKKAKRKVGEL